MRCRYWLAVMAMAACGTSGCEDAKYQDYSQAPLSAGHGHDHNHDHGHGEAGNHGGYVLEFDDAHAYHGELTFDLATRDVTVYFYGAEVGKAKAAQGVTLSLHDGDAHKDLVAKPMPLEGETGETTSRWVISGTNLPVSIKSEEQIDGHLEATMDGKAFSYALEPHSHDHGVHTDHDHADSDR